ncbi:arginase family protein [Xylella fastidiosa]|uniref:arginase family protein n=1 Tax=Xylella fastidiosa TaxID=2371 RepID=UPI000FFF1190|nr:amino acid deaminase [Xylella fastidiosa subsp. multiplex]
MKDAMSIIKKKTIRMLFPQWQGGNQELYSLGARLLAWLAPETEAPVFEVNVPDFKKETPEPERGVIYRQQLFKQYDEAYRLLEREDPDYVVIFGGDCLVDLAPFAWLNEKHHGQLGVLWIDAHPDIKTPQDSMNGHTMVLGSFLGEGDNEFAAKVKVPLKPSRVMFAGLIETGLTEQESEVIHRLGLNVAKPEVLFDNSQTVIDWVRKEKIEELVIHFDLDVLNPDVFRSLLFAEPEPEFDWRATYPVGQLRLAQVIRLIRDVAAETELVAIGITEHLPWDVWHLKESLSKVPLLNR